MTAVDVERVLTVLGHVRVPNTRCAARVAETPPELRPPGPQNPPMWCCLPEGHDGQHRHNGGGMYPSIPFRDTDEVVMGEPLPDYCEKCRRVWPCDDAKMFTRAVGITQEADGCRDRCQRIHPHCRLTLARDIWPDKNWHWSVTMPDGHLYDNSHGAMSFEQAVADLQSRGVTALDAADTIWRKSHPTPPTDGEEKSA